MILSIQSIAKMIINNFFKDVVQTKGEIPKTLTHTQQMFLHWNAERLNLSFEESQNRYFTSWSGIRGGHKGLDYRKFNDLSYSIFQVFFSDTESEIYKSYEFYGPMHFLRMLSYAEPRWNEEHIIVRSLFDYETVNIMDYGCGLAQQSRTLAKYLKNKGVQVNLFLIDIPTIRKDFLIWLGKQENIPTTFIDCTEDIPIPRLPECDVCFATEFFEHVYEPLPYFNNIHSSLAENGLIVTDVSNHEQEFMHVSPNLQILRDRIKDLNYTELQLYQIYKKCNAS